MNERERMGPSEEEGKEEVGQGEGAGIDRIVNVVERVLQPDLRIVSLDVENFMRLKAVRLAAAAAVNVVTGDNQAGKTALLDSIETGLAGGKKMPVQPIRRGQQRGHVVLTLSDGTRVRRWWTTTNRGQQSHLEVVASEGAKILRPQALLDKLFDERTMDPLAFFRADGGAQASTLLLAAGLTERLTELADLETAAFDERRLANRTLLALEGQLEALAEPEEGLPTTEVSVVGLVGRMRQAEEQVASNAAERAGVARMVGELEELALEILETEGQLEELRAAKAEVETTLEKVTGAVNAQPTPEDVDALTADIAAAEETNRGVAAARIHREKHAECCQATDAARALHSKVEEIREQRRQLLVGAEYPVPELTVGEDGVSVLYRRLPVSQASSQERLWIGLLLARAMKPGLKVALVRDGNCLDEPHLSMLAEMAGRLGLQLWVERVGGREPGSIHIVEGEVEADGEETAGGAAAEGTDGGGGP